MGTGIGFPGYHFPVKILITVCARGGSKGIPGKNIRPLGGIPLIGYTIRHAKAFAAKHSADIALSTDSDAIRSVAAQLGLATDYVRPAELATDQAGKVPAMHHVLEYEERRRGQSYDLLLDLDVTSLLRTPEDLDAGLHTLLADPHALNLFSVSVAERNPYFNMVEQGRDGYYHLSKPLQHLILSRQAAPAVYELNASFYFFRREFFRQGWKEVYSDRALIYLMPHLCFDLDEAVDFDFLEFLVREHRLGFAL